MHALGRAVCVQLRDCLDYLRRRRARIAGDHADARLQGGMGERLVAHQQLFRHTLPHLKAVFSQAKRKAVSRETAALSSDYALHDSKTKAPLSCAFDARAE